MAQHLLDRTSRFTFDQPESRFGGGRKGIQTPHAEQGLVVTCFEALKQFLFLACQRPKRLIPLDRRKLFIDLSARFEKGFLLIGIQ